MKTYTVSKISVIRAAKVLGVLYSLLAAVSAGAETLILPYSVYAETYGEEAPDSARERIWLMPGTKIKLNESLPDLRTNIANNRAFNVWATFTVLEVNGGTPAKAIGQQFRAAATDLFFARNTVYETLYSEGGKARLEIRQLATGDYQIAIVCVEPTNIVFLDLKGEPLTNWNVDNLIKAYSPGRAEHLSYSATGLKTKRLFYLFPGEEFESVGFVFIHSAPKFNSNGKPDVQDFAEDIPIESYFTIKHGKEIVITQKDGEVWRGYKVDVKNMLPADPVREQRETAELLIPENELLREAYSLLERHPLSLKTLELATSTFEDYLEASILIDMRRIEGIPPMRRHEALEKFLKRFEKVVEADRAALLAELEDKTFKELQFILNSVVSAMYIIRPKEHLNKHLDGFRDLFRAVEQSALERQGVVNVVPFEFSNRFANLVYNGDFDRIERDIKHHVFDYGKEGTAIFSRLTGYHWSYFPMLISFVDVSDKEWGADQVNGSIKMRFDTTMRQFYGSALGSEVKRTGEIFYVDKALGPAYRKVVLTSSATLLLIYKSFLDYFKMSRDVRKLVQRGKGSPEVKLFIENLVRYGNKQPSIQMEFPTKLRYPNLGEEIEPRDIPDFR